jgi:hypothetical protein
VRGNLQATGKITGIDTPEHQKHQHVILLRSTGCQYAIRPGGIFG